MDIPRRALTPEQVAETYSIPRGSLANWRCKKIGPKYFRVGRKVLYLIEDVESFIKSTPVMTTGSLPGSSSDSFTKEGRS